jgi:hypothetical protein
VRRACRNTEQERKVTATRKTTRIHAQAIYRDAATTVRARIAADGTLLITRRAYLAAKSRACYAGTDELHLLPAAGRRDWSEAQGNPHQGAADGKTLPRGTWYARPQ